MELTEASKSREKWIGVYIAVLAVILAICSMGGDNATKDATLKNIEAANTWSFFQAKNMRRHVLRLQADEFELKIATEAELPAEARAKLTAKVEDYRKQEQHLTSDPEKGEGLDELFQKGRALEAERDYAMKRDPYFDYAQALLQIAIVLASVALITRHSNILLGASGMLGLTGALLTINGFVLAAHLPFVN